MADDNRDLAALCHASVVDLAKQLAAREVSAVEVMEAHLARIAELNPALNAIVTLRATEELLDEARAADTRRLRGDVVGPLHGIPVAIKDLVETAGLRTTFGSPIFADNVPSRNAVIVQRLEDAGAIVVGKTNTPEFGAGGARTYNRVFGATRNPYAPELSTAGSSGGSAAAVATGMVPFADGTDMGGSLRHPASFCNVVGLRPSPGRIPEVPTTDPWDPFTVAGVIARNVSDIAFLLDTLADPDPRCPLTAPPPRTSFSDALTGDVGGVRIAWSRTLGGLPVESVVTDVLEANRAVLQDCGCVVEDAEPDLSSADEVFDVLRGLSFVRAHGERLQTHRELLKETIVWNVELGLGLDVARIARAQAARSELFLQTFDFLTDYDVLAAPVSQVAPFSVDIDWVTEIEGTQFDDYLEWQRSCSRITATTHPAISVPGGFTDDGRPIGLQLVARYGNEETLLRVARALERATGFGLRRPIDVS